MNAKAKKIIKRTLKVLLWTVVTLVVLVALVLWAVVWAISPENLTKYAEQAANEYLDAKVDPELEGSPDENVYQQDDRGVGASGQECIKSYEKDHYAYDCQQDIPVSHTGAQQFVVDMVLVRQERIAAFADAVDDHAHDVEQRDYQRGKGDDSIPGCILSLIYRERQAQYEETQYVAQGQTACVSHEKLVPLTGVPENIVEPERDDYPEGRQSQKGMDILVPHQQHDTQDCQ